MKPADAKLVEEFPLPVQFPGLSGVYYLLVWWTHDEQHHISIGHTPGSVIQLFSKLLESKYEDAEPRRFYEIDIVAPPDRFKVAHAKNAREWRLYSFRDWVARNLSVVEPKLPLGFSRCPGFKAADTSCDDSDGYAEQVHYDCLNCTKGGYVFDVEAQYLRLKGKYLNENNEYIQKYDPMKVSRASPAKTGQKLYTVQDRHGHHSDGTVVEPVPKNAGGSFGVVKFFCHAKELPIPSEIVDHRKDLEKKWEEMDKNREKRRVEETLAREEAERVRARAIFS